MGEHRCGTCYYFTLEPDPGTYGVCVWAQYVRLPPWMQPNNEDGVAPEDGGDCRVYEYWGAPR